MGREDSYDVISVMGHSSELKKIKKKCEKEEGRKNDMCQGITDLIEDGRQEGLQEGLQEGRKEGSQETLVSSVENIMKNLGLALREACKAVGTTEEAYLEARRGLVSVVELLKLDDDLERSFYEKEHESEHWGVPSHKVT